MTSVKPLLPALFLALSLPAIADDLPAPSTTTDSPPSPSATPAASAMPGKRYVSDNLITYVHSGPGKQFRVVGAVKAGEAVSFVGLDDSGKYAQILDSKGKQVWINAQELQSSESFREQANRLQEQNKHLQHQIDNLDSDQSRELKDKRERVNQLEQQVKQQSEQLTTQALQLKKLQQENQNLNESLGTREQDQQFRLWREGGYIAGAGLLIGFILAFLPRPGRRRKSGWMD